MMSDYYDEAANAYAALAKIIRTYDAYRRRGVIPAPVEYEAVVAAINDARKIMAPQYQFCDDCPPVGYPTDKTRCAPCPRREATSCQS